MNQRQQNLFLFTSSYFLYKSFLFKMKIRGYLLAIVSAVSFGLIPLFVIPVKQINFSMNITLFYRFLIAAILIIPILLYKKEKLKVSFKELSILISLGLFYALGSDTLFIAYDFLTPGIASTIFFIYPVFVALAMSLFFNEKLSKLTFISLFITLFGVYILSIKNSGEEINMTGMLIAVSSALSYCIYILIVNQSKLNESGWKITFYTMVFASVYFLVKNFTVRESFEIPSISMIFDFTVFAFVTTVISVSTLVYAIKLIGSTPASILGALEPVVAVLVSILIFGEVFTKNLFWGILLILFGVIMSIIGESRKNKI